MKHALALVARDVPVLGQAQRQVAVRATLGAEDEARAGAVHRLERELPVVDVREVHVLAVVVVVPRSVPELDVHDVGRLDLRVAALFQLRVHLGLDQAQEHGALREPEGHPGRLRAKHEEPELAAEAAVVALARLLQEALVLLEVGLLEERGAVDPAEHRPALVAAPVGARDRGELERLDALRRRAVRAQAEVREGAVAIKRDRLDALIANEVLDQLDLVRLVLGGEPLERLFGRHVGALELLVGRDVARHRLLDLRQVVDRGPEVVRELEVVVEAVLDRRSDRDLRPGPELDHRGRQDVRGVVADQRERLGVAIGQDRDLGSVREAPPRGLAARRRP